MAAKTLRVIQPSKYTGIFTREEIRRAVQLAAQNSPDKSLRREHSASSKSVSSNGTHGCR